MSLRFRLGSILLSILLVILGSPVTQTHADIISDNDPLTRIGLIYTKDGEHLGFGELVEDGFARLITVDMPALTRLVNEPGIRAVGPLEILHGGFSVRLDLDDEKFPENPHLNIVIAKKTPSHRTVTLEQPGSPEADFYHLDFERGVRLVTSSLAPTLGGTSTHHQLSIQPVIDRALSSWRRTIRQAELRDEILSRAGTENPDKQTLKKESPYLDRTINAFLTPLRKAQVDGQIEGTSRFIDTVREHLWARASGVPVLRDDYNKPSAMQRLGDLLEILEGHLNLITESEDPDSEDRRRLAQEAYLITLEIVLTIGRARGSNKFREWVECLPFLGLMIGGLFYDGLFHVKMIITGGLLLKLVSNLQLQRGFRPIFLVPRLDRVLEPLVQRGRLFLLRQKIKKLVSEAPKGHPLATLLQFMDEKGVACEVFLAGTSGDSAAPSAANSP